MSSGAPAGSHLSSDGSVRPLPRILCARFNQTASCLAVGTTEGYRILNCEPFAKCYEAGEGGVSIVEMLFNTSLLCLVGAGLQASHSPRRLLLYNTARGRPICELNFLSTVLSVAVNYRRLVAVLESKLHVFDTASLKILHTVDTPANPAGICAMAHGSAHSYLAYPASSERGELFLYDAEALEVVGVVRAHNAPIRLCAFNAEGTLLATASAQGTVIRVFSVPHGRKLCTFRRGTYPAKINCIAFNRRGDMLVVSSADSSTVHVFSMRE